MDDSMFRKTMEKVGNRYGVKFGNEKYALKQ